MFKCALESCLISHKTKTCVYVCASVYTHMGLLSHKKQRHVCTCVYTHVCLYMFACVCVYTCVCVCVHIRENLVIIEKLLFVYLLK